MEQINIFDELYPKYVLNENKKTRLITLFSGYDSQKLAFNYLGKEVEHYRVCEFDKYAINTLNEIHNTNFETTDIKSIGGGYLNIVEKDKYNYIMTYSFPCTDLSIAGKREGMERDSGTRSGLLWEVERLLKETKELPDVLIMENVPQVLKANGWYEWCEFLENLGYNNYAEVINAKRFGIPQNRERCFMVSILGDYSYNFPKGFELKYRLKDLLEENVDEKYYLSDRQIKCLSSTKDFNGYKRGKQFLKNINREITTTITASGSDRSSDTFVCEDTKVIGKIEEWHQRGFIYDENGIIPTLCSTDYKTPKLVQHSIKNNHNIDVVENKNMKQKLCNQLIEKGRLDVDCRAYFENGVAPTTTTSPKSKVLLNDLRIRKLTPKECFRLMGVKDTDYNKITCSNAQKYKQAGNSIVTTCLMAIYSQLYKDCDYKSKIDDLLKELTTSNDDNKQINK